MLFVVEAGALVGDFLGVSKIRAGLEVTIIWMIKDFVLVEVKVNTKGDVSGDSGGKEKVKGLFENSEGHGRRRWDSNPCGACTPSD